MADGAPARPTRRRRGAGGPRRRGEADPARPLAPRGVERHVHAGRAGGPGRGPLRGRRQLARGGERRSSSRTGHGRWSRCSRGRTATPATGPSRGSCSAAATPFLYIFDANGRPGAGGRPAGRRADRPARAGRPRPRPPRPPTGPTSGRRRSSSPRRSQGRRERPGTTVQVPVRVLTQRGRRAAGRQHLLPPGPPGPLDRGRDAPGAADRAARRRRAGRGRRRVAFGWLVRPARARARSASRSAPSGRPSAASASSPPTPRHELRTPLTVIRSSLEHASATADAAGGASPREALDDIDAEVTHLTAHGRRPAAARPLRLRRGGHRADAARPGRRGLRRRRPRSAGWRRRAASTSRWTRSRRWSIGDPARLRQLVTILVDNAVRHSPRGGSVTVPVRRPGAVAAIEVADQGPGIRDGGHGARLRPVLAGAGRAVRRHRPRPRDRELDRRPPRRPDRRRQPRAERGACSASSCRRSRGPRRRPRSRSAVPRRRLPVSRPGRRDPAAPRPVPSAIVWAS